MVSVSCKSIFRYFKRIDIFGVSLSFSYNSKSSYKTLFGSILTIILFSLLFYKLILSVKNLILKENLDVQLTEVPGIDDKIKVKSGEIAVCPLYNFINLSKTDNFFNISYSYTNDKFETQKFGNLSKNCTGEIKLGNGIFKTNEYCYCLKFNDMFYFDLTKNSTVYSDMFLSINVKADFRTVDQSLNNNKFFRTILFMYRNHYVNISDYDNLIRSYQTGISDIMNVGSSMNINLGVDKIQVDTFSSYTFGLVDPEIYTNYSYSIYRKDSQIASSSSTSGYSEINYKIRHNGLIKIYSINTFNMELFFGLFGGNFQVFFIVFNFISTIINEKSFERKIKSRFKKMMDIIEKLFKEIDENTLSNLNESNNAENVRGINDNKNDLNLCAKYKNEKITSEISLTPLKSHERRKTGILYNNFHTNNPSIIELDKKPKDSHFTLQTYQSPDQIQHPKDYYKEIKEDFLCQLDYDKFYKIVKEVKLMKFFLMDAIGLKWVNKLIEYPLNVDKFDRFIQEYQPDCNPEYNNLNSTQKKLKSIKEFLLVSISKKLT